VRTAVLVCGCTLSWRSTTLGLSIWCHLFFMALCSSFSVSINFWYYVVLLHQFYHQHAFPILSQKTVAITFLAGRCLFKLFQFVWWLCVQSTALTAFFISAFTNQTQFSSPVTHMMWLRNPSPSLWYALEK
jgi:hypothetical protein